MIILLVDPNSMVETALSAVQRAHPGVPVKIVATGATPPALPDRVECAYLSGYSQLTFRERLDTARRFSQSWYYSDGTDCTVWGPISAGAVAEIDFFLFFVRLIEDVDMLCGLLMRERPERVYLCGANQRYLEALFRAVAPDMPTVRGGRTRRGRDRAGESSLRAWLKRRGLDRALSFVANQVLASVHPGFRTRPVPYSCHVILFEMIVPSSYETLSTAYEQLAAEPVAVLSTDPRATLRLLRKGLRPLVLSEGDSAQARAIEGAARRSLRQTWRRLVQRPPSLRLHGHDLWPLVRAKAHDFFRFQAALIMREHACLRTLAERQGWRTTISSSHLHHFGRLCTVLSDQGGPASITIQHGVVGVHTYLPMLATRIAVWGELVREWFVAQGVDPARVVITGQPRFKRAKPGDAPPDPLGPGGGVVLIATQPLGGSFQRAVSEAVLAAARALPALRFVFRPHPDEPLEQYETACRASQLPNLVVERGGLVAALETASFVITHSSTVGLEALLLQRPLIVFNPFGWPEEVPYVSSGAAQEVRDGQELAAYLARLLEAPGAYAAAVRTAQRFVDGYVNFDQQSGERLRELLRTFASR
ncbi:MAG TPA: hypothetical protein PKD53_09090 [Chloroflexaceae bacterium]|nr:hypothetical protein [Chloroflexaceae bacterium]